MLNEFMSLVQPGWLLIITAPSMWQPILIDGAYESTYRFDDKDHLSRPEKSFALDVRTFSEEKTFLCVKCIPIFGDLVF